MEIRLSEHRKFKILDNAFQVENETKKKNLKYFSTEELEQVKNLSLPIFKEEKKQKYKCIELKTIENGIALNANYYVGIDWLISNKHHVIVEPKINTKIVKQFETLLEQEEVSANEKLDRESKKIIQNEYLKSYEELDYLQMLLEVMAEPFAAQKANNLVKIDWNAPQIQIKQQKDKLTPFLVIQFLQLLQKIVHKGLKKSYYKKKENLRNRVKGKILVGQHIKQNVLKNKFSNTLCEYQEFGLDNLENRFLKKVWSFAAAYVNNNKELFKSSKANVYDLINYCRPALEQIGDKIDIKNLKNSKKNPFYKEYAEAIKIGQYILKKFSYNITNTALKKVSTPPFWIDMPYLFELYFYSKLLKANKNDITKIHFQFSTYGNALDFLIAKEGNEMIIDTKYKLQYQSGKVHQDIRQVAGYARLGKVRKKLNLNEKSDKIIDCLIVYPLFDSENEGKTIKDYALQSICNQLESNKINVYHKVYKLGINLPLIKHTDES